MLCQEINVILFESKWLWILSFFFSILFDFI